MTPSLPDGWPHRVFSIVFGYSRIDVAYEYGLERGAVMARGLRASRGRVAPRPLMSATPGLSSLLGHPWPILIECTRP